MTTTTAADALHMAACDPDLLICALLRREPCRWDPEGGEAEIHRFLEAARFHRVLPLLDAEFRRRDDADAWPKEIVLACCRAALAHASLEQAHRAEAARVIEALAAGGIRPLVLKGSALACSHYDDPALRPRSDTDLLVAHEHRSETERLLLQLGYAREPGVQGEFIAYESLWSRRDESGRDHRVDVHWRINNSQALANVLVYEDLAARSVALPELGVDARALAPVDALVLACIHRAGHSIGTVSVNGVARRESDLLIWLYDIHLLVSRMPERELDAFAESAKARKVCAVCLDGIRKSGERLGTAIPARVLQSLGEAGLAEPSAILLGKGAGRRMVADFLGLPGWPERLRWLRELAFPAADYMRWKYPEAAASSLPVLHLRRGISALARLFSPSGKGM